MWRDLTMQQKSDLMRRTGIYDPPRLSKMYDEYSQGGHLHQSEGEMKVLKVGEDGLPGYVLPEVVIEAERSDDRLQRLSDWYHRNADRIPRFVHRAVYNTIKDSAFNEDPIGEIKHNIVPNLVHNKAGWYDNMFLMSPRQQEKQLGEVGYARVGDDYGLVDAAVRRYKDATGREVPVYQMGQDDAQREDLIPLRNNIYGAFLPQGFSDTDRLGDIGSAPYRLYRDTEGNLYYKRWDFFDHGDYSRRAYSADDDEYVTKPLTANSQRYGNLLDNMGNPFVKTTGYARVDAEDLAKALRTLQGVGYIYGDKETDSIMGNVKKGMYDYSKGGSIHIDPKNRGKFNETKRRTGKTTEELTHSKNPLTRKRAVFAQNAAKWRRGDGGYLDGILFDQEGYRRHSMDDEPVMGIIGRGGVTPISTYGMMERRPLLLESNTGDRRVVPPNRNVVMEGDYVIERPLFQQGGYLEGSQPMRGSYGLTAKPFSYTGIPVVRYQEGGNEMQLGGLIKRIGRNLFDKQARNAPRYGKDIGFAEAFSEARKNGAETFYWGNDYFNTNLANDQSFGNKIQATAPNYFLNNGRYERYDWSDTLANSLHNALHNDSTINFKPEHIAMVIGDESNFSKFRRGYYTDKNGNKVYKKFVGPFQMDEAAFNRIYSLDNDGVSGSDVYSQYINNTRSDDDVVRDIIKYLRWMDGRIKSERDKMGYGRMKINQYAPNAKLDDIVSDQVWDNNVAYEISNGKLSDTLVKGSATYRDLMNGYDEWAKNNPWIVE